MSGAAVTLALGQWRCRQVLLRYPTLPMLAAPSHSHKELAMADDDNYEVPNVMPIAQPTTKTCWLACYRMLFKYASQPLASTEEKLAATYGAATFDSIVNETGLLDEHLAKAAGALGLSGMTKRSLSDINSFSEYLRLSGPLMCTGTFAFRKVTGLHAVIICGVNMERKTLTMIDPYYEISPSDVKKYPITHSVLIDKLRDVQFSNQGWWVKPTAVAGA